MAACIAQVDTIQTQEWPARGIALGHLAVMALKHLMQVVTLAQGSVALLLPVIEITGNDHRLMGRQGFEQLVEQHDLQLAMAFQQAQMHANGMHIVMPRHIQHTVQ